MVLIILIMAFLDFLGPNKTNNLGLARTRVLCIFLMVIIFHYLSFFSRFWAEIVFNGQSWVILV
jgi:hypothetical protein